MPTCPKLEDVEIGAMGSLSSSANPFVLEHLGRSLWMRDYTPQGLFALLTCYFDDAGGADHGYTVVAGWIASVEQWAAFAEDWETLLSEYGLASFTMKECAQWQGPFKCWREEQRRSFIRRACQILKTHVQYGYASIVQHAEYLEVNKAYKLREYTKSEYALAGVTCVRNVWEWGKVHHPGVPMEVIFHQGTKGRGGLAELMEEEFKYSPIFRSASEQEGPRPVIPLQVADFLAYEVRKVRKDDPSETRPIEKHRISLRMLISVPNDWGQYTEQDLVTMCEKHPRIEKRLRS
jgi:hypothetical protein